MDGTVKQFIAVLLSHDDPDQRRLAAEELVHSADYAPIAALAAALQDGNKGVRDAAFRSLVSIGGAKVARATVEYIGHENIVTRNLAADLLVRIGESAVSAIIPHLYDPDHDVRKFAVDILGLIRSKTGISDIVARLDDRDPNVQLAAVEALGNIGDRQAIEPLWRTYEKYPITRPCVVEALGKIGDPCTTKVLLRIMDYDITDTRDCILEYAVIEALGNVGNELALTRLIEKLRTSSGTIARALVHSIVQIQERLGHRIYFARDARAHLFDALNDASPKIRISAVKGLERFKGDDITIALMKALGRDESLDAYLIPLLVERENTLGLALTQLQEGGSNTRSIIMLIGKLAQIAIRSIFSGNERSIDTDGLQRAFGMISHKWQTANEETRAVIVDVLFTLDGDHAMLFLDKILEDQDPWLRIHVIEILSQIDDPRTPEMISRFLQDDDEVVREVVMHALETKGYSTTDTQVC